jgi:dihydrofolate reductase
MSERRIIAAMQVSVDGMIEGPNGEVDWVGSWDDSFGLLSEIDTCVLGGGMYPGYEEYWTSILANPEGVLALTGQVPNEDEVAYARFADRTPHFVLSSTLGEVHWKTSTVIRDLDEIRRLKQQPGKGIYAVGGATFIARLMNEGLVDELRLTVRPIVLGRGKPLFKDVSDRHALTLVRAEARDGEKVGMIYRPTSSA